MAKKIGIGLIILVILGVLFFPDILYFSAKRAFAPENRNKSWAPTTAYNAGKMYQRFLRFGAALQVYQKCLKTFPDAPWVPECKYRIAFCNDKQGNTAKALAGYELFMKQYPNHPLTKMAETRHTHLKATE